MLRFSERAIVKELHSHNIVWGDFQPGNIVIDKYFNAQVIEFSGGQAEGFVDRKKAGKKEGDWQGVQRIFYEWFNQPECHLSIFRCHNTVEAGNPNLSLQTGNKKMRMHVNFSDELVLIKRRLEELHLCMTKTGHSKDFRHVVTDFGIRRDNSNT